MATNLGLVGPARHDADRSTRQTPPPGRLNVGLSTAVLAVHAGLFFALPLVVTDTALALVLMLAASFMVVPLWALIHEAIHGHLTPDARTNDRLGRVLSIAFLAPFETLRFGHLSHHALNASGADRPELFDRAATPRWRASLLFYFRLLLGLWLVEVLSGPLSWLPRARLEPIVARLFDAGPLDPGSRAERAVRKLLEPARLRRTRIDAALIMLLLVAVFWSWAAAPLVLMAFIIARGVITSLLDNAPHYGGELGDPGQGSDMRAPPVIAAFALNSNLHGTHHRHPGLPWTALPARLRADGRVPGTSYLLTPWRQFRGPIAIEPERSDHEA